MRRLTTRAGAPATIITLLALLVGLLAATAPPSASAGAAPATLRAPVHDAFYAALRLRGHGQCVIGKTDAQLRAHLRCRDGLAVRLRPCRYEDSRHCFWHAAVRGNGQGRSFVVYEGRHHFRP